MKGLDTDFGIIQVKAEMKLWKWVSSLKEKWDSKKQEWAVTEHREKYSQLPPEHGGGNLTENRKFKDSDKNLPYHWVKIIGVF